MYTTHVGSFPLEYSLENVSKVLADLFNIGLDYPPHPQLRDFIECYLQPLISEGIIEKRGGAFFLKSELNSFSWEIKPLEEQVKVAQEFNVKYRGRARGLRACVTGPFTLASSIYTTKTPSIFTSLAANRRIVGEFFAEYVRRFIIEVAKLNAYDLIVIDEPILSVICGRRIILGYRASEISEILNSLFENIQVKYKGIHVCGVLSPSIKEVLLNVVNLNILDHEHKDHPQNIKVYVKDELEAHEKYLALGVVSSKKPIVESVNEIMEFINAARNELGERIMFVKPDCGFRGLRGFANAYSISLDKLKNVVLAVRKIVEE